MVTWEKLRISKVREQVPLRGDYFALNLQSTQELNLYSIHWIACLQLKLWHLLNIFVSLRSLLRCRYHMCLQISVNFE